MQKLKRLNKLKVLIALFILGWFIYSIIHPPIWVGQSADGNWRIVYDEYYKPKDTWKETAHWRGKHNINVTYIESMINESVHSPLSVGEREEMSPNSKYEYGVFGPRLESDSDYTVTIRWEQDGEIFEENIEMKPRKRWIVIPFVNG